MGVKGEVDLTEITSFCFSFPLCIEIMKKSYLTESFFCFFVVAVTAY